MVHIDRVKIMGALRILPHEVYVAWMNNLSEIKFLVELNTLNNAITKNQLLKLEKGGSFLPRLLTIDRLIPKLKYFIILLNRIKIMGALRIMKQEVY